MRDYTHPSGKPVYSYSLLRDVYKCPYKSVLARRFEPLFSESTKNSMRDGNIFERYVFGDFDNELKLHEGKKKPETLGVLKRAAEFVKPRFIGGPDSFIQEELVYEAENWVLKGHIDYRGPYHGFFEKIRNQIEPMRTLVDLKLTGDIGYVWDGKESKWDFLQGVIYPYLVWKVFGEKLDFRYVVVETADHDTDPFVRELPIVCTEESFQWLEDLLDDLVSQPFLQATANEYNCLGAGIRNPRCEHLHSCEYGRSLIDTGNVVIEFDNLS